MVFLWIAITLFASILSYGVVKNLAVPDVPQDNDMWVYLNNPLESTNITTEQPDGGQNTSGENSSHNSSNISDNGGGDGGGDGGGNGSGNGDGNVRANLRSSVRVKSGGNVGGNVRGSVRGNSGGKDGSNGRGYVAGKGGSNGRGYVAGKGGSNGRGNVDRIGGSNGRGYGRGYDDGNGGANIGGNGITDSSFKENGGSNDNSGNDYDFRGRAGNSVSGDSKPQTRQSGRKYQPADEMGDVEYLGV